MVYSENADSYDEFMKGYENLQDRNRWLLPDLLKLLSARQ